MTMCHPHVRMCDSIIHKIICFFSVYSSLFLEKGVQDSMKQFFIGHKLHVIQEEKLVDHEYLHTPTIRS